MASLRSSGGHSVSPTTHNAEDWKLTILVSVSEIGTCKSKVPWEVQGAPPASQAAVKNKTNRGSRPNLASKIKEEDEARAEAAPEIAAKGCVWNRRTRVLEGAIQRVFQETSFEIAKICKNQEK